MADGTHIEWTDATANAINGCSLESPGCTNCYAMRLAGTRLKHHPSRIGLTQETKAGPVWTGEVRLNDTALLQPLSWQRPRMIFWNAHGDMFHPSVPVEWIDRQFAVMTMADWHTHQILTKRSARMREYLSHPTTAGRIFGQLAGLWPGKNSGVRFSEAATRLSQQWPLPNVWCGVSAEDQTRWDQRVADLRETPAAVRWVSAEPLLGLIRDDREMAGIDWVVAGGESGPGARPIHPDWARGLRDQCEAAAVSFLFKQWGEYRPAASASEAGSYPIIANNRKHLPVGDPRRDAMAESGLYHMPHQIESKLDGTGQFAHLNCAMVKVGKKAAGRLLDGVEHNGYPA